MIIIDVEIKKAILGRNEEPLPGIEYCAGWRDFENMGISCVCTYDITTHLSRTFLEEDLPALAAYIRGKPTAGFNTRRFDLQLLARYGLQHGEKSDWVWADPHYDMLEEIWLALGLNPDKYAPATHGGWGLDAVCGATLGIHKTGDGATAAIWWQQGKRGKVIDYCLNDVWMEGQLLLYILRGGIPMRPDGKSVRVRLPEWAVGAQNAERWQSFAQPVDEPPAAPAERAPGGLGIIR